MGSKVGQYGVNVAAHEFPWRHFGGTLASIWRQLKYLVLWFKKVAARGVNRDSWNPYADILYEWNHEDRDDESKSELQFGSNYILPNIDSDTESIAKLVRAPSITGGKPKPVKRSYGEVDDMDGVAIKRAAKRGKKCIPNQRLSEHGGGHNNRNKNKVMLKMFGFIGVGQSYSVSKKQNRQSAVVWRPWRHLAALSPCP
ncbi:hypothetical protein K438DRAFT_1789871 [Mycena galopus ATCC 62051]|nr:hypothetical protein K438DRAFT_1789871 [Mycena galopus ATCC 62051]